MNDSELTRRPAKGWTRWREGPGGYEIERVWWQSKMLHFLKLGSTCWFDGSDLVGIELWQGHKTRWCMRQEPADWQPRPPGHLAAAERAWLAFRSLALHQERHTGVSTVQEMAAGPAAEAVLELTLGFCRVGRRHFAQLTCAIYHSLDNVFAAKMNRHGNFGQVVPIQANAFPNNKCLFPIGHSHRDGLVLLNNNWRRIPQGQREVAAVFQRDGESPPSHDKLAPFSGIRQANDAASVGQTISCLVERHKSGSKRLFDPQHD
nr:hypothetical protein [Mesorhizobium sp.]